MPEPANSLPNRPNRLPDTKIFRVVWPSSLLFLGFTLVIGMFGGLFVWAPTSNGLFETALLALIVPSLLEEIVFRAPILFLRSSQIWIGMIWSIFGYMGWHIFEALTFLSASALWFLRIDFLMITALFGAIAGYIVLQTRKIWPTILLHWAMVIIWKQLLGGPELMGS